MTSQIQPFLGPWRLPPHSLSLWPDERVGDWLWVRTGAGVVMKQQWKCGGKEECSIQRIFERAQVALGRWKSTFQAILTVSGFD